MNRRYGFTIVELILVITVVAILAALVVVSYQGVQRRAASVSTQSALEQGTDALQLYDTHNHLYPGNIADTDFVPPTNAALVLYTNADQVPVYQSLSSAQNAQLFLNTCNASMPIVSGGTTYNTSCSFNGGGLNLHVAGQSGSNWVKSTPIQQSDFVLICGSACTTAQNTIVSDFLAQGGTFPINGIGGGSTLPAPTPTTFGNASRFCLESRALAFPDIVYHTSNDDTRIQAGACPVDATLHYP
jgi:prepilin-type N-terminal cleavage/methylation domain-containing protein